MIELKNNYQKRVDVLLKDNRLLADELFKEKSISSRCNSFSKIMVSAILALCIYIIIN